LKEFGVLLTLDEWFKQTTRHNKRPQLNFFNFDLKKIFVLAILVAIPLFSVNMQQKSKDKPWILLPFYHVTGVSQNLYATFSAGVRSTTDLYINLVDIKKNNRVLNQELTELKAQLGALTELSLENQRLSQLLDFKQRGKMDLLAARIIGRDALSDYDTITIDRGTTHGVKKGMGTITISGVVGYISSVENNSAKILLLTDRYSVIDGVVQRSRARGMVQGVSKEKCSLTFLKRTDDVLVGDIVVTSGLDNYFPKGFPIGTVTDVAKEKYGLGQEVKLQPIVTAPNIEEVFVVIKSNNQDFEERTE
jgi:rod shape-determining protein MreC